MGNPIVDIAAAIIALIAIVAIAGFLRSDPYEQIGAGSLSFQHEDEDAEAAEIASRHAHDEEIRQMLQARSERLTRRGEPPLDVEAELARLREGGATAGDEGATGREEGS
ncbi:MAG: hypothetical protein ACYCSI_14310 [Solirubrobacteraceae bacterium]